MSLSAYDGFKTSKVILQITGNWPESPTTWSRIRGIIFFSTAVVFLITSIMELVKDLEDYVILSEQLSITIPLSQCLLKIVIFRGKHRQLLILLRQLSVQVFNNHPQHLDVIMEKSVRQTEIVGRLYRYVGYTIVVLSCAAPLVANMDLPIRFTYDLGPFRSFMYIFQIVGLANAIIVNSNVDLIGVNLMGMAGIQIDILNQKIIEFRRKSKKDGRDTEICMSNLKNCVEHHMEIIRYIENLENVFCYILLVEFLTSAIIICNIGFELVHIKPSNFEFAIMVSHFTALTSQLGLYCWYGNEIILKSMDIKDACYASDWTGCDVKVLKMLIIIMERSKRPLFLTAGKFATVSLASLGSILNTTYSYFTLLQNLYGDEEN